MLKIAVVEDNARDREIILEYLKRYEKERRIAFDVNTFSDGEEFLQAYKGGYDLCLMDIAMPMMNGLKTAKNLRKIDKSVCIVFITTMAQYAIKGYEVNATDFLVKPVDYDLFRIKMNKAVSLMKKERDSSFLIVMQGEVKRVPLSEIVYIESNAHYLYFNTTDERYKMRELLKNVSDYFAKNNFLKINRSLMVNLAYVDGYSKNEVSVGGETLPVSRVYRTEFLDKLTAYLGRKGL